jgi:hypothetical protein
MSPEERRYFERLIDTYTENIRAADVKANIVGIIVVFSISVLTLFRPDLPAWLPFYVVLLAPILSLVFLLVSIFPRFSAHPGFPFRIGAAVPPDVFAKLPKDDSELALAYETDCSALAGILYRKVFHFRVAMAFCFLYVALLLCLAIGGAIERL